MFKIVRADEVKAGDFVLNVGKIDTVRVYGQELAIHGKTDDASEYRMYDPVQRETAIQAEYAKVCTETPDRVIWEVGHKTFRFDLDKQVKVFRA